MGEQGERGLSLKGKPSFPLLKSTIPAGRGIYRIMGKFDERAVILGKYIASSADTVRGAAKKYGMAKSTVHKVLTTRLPHVDAALWEKVKRVLETNLAERHLRGGEATKRKYLGRREKRTV